MAEDQALALAGPAADGDLEPVVLNVAAGGENEDLLRDVVKVPWLGASRERRPR